MKRFKEAFNCVKAFVLISFIIFFSGCSTSEITQKDPTLNFSCDADILMNKDTIKCKIHRNAEGLSEIEVTSPTELEGVCFKWLGNMYSISYNGLSCETQTSFLPVNSFASSIVNVLNEAAKPDSLTYKSCQNGITEYSGNSESGKFEIAVDNSTSHINELKIDDSGLKVKFFNYF